MVYNKLTESLSLSPAARASLFHHRASLVIAIAMDGEAPSAPDDHIRHSETRSRHDAPSTAHFSDHGPSVPSTETTDGSQGSRRPFAPVSAARLELLASVAAAVSLADSTLR